MNTTVSGGFKAIVAHFVQRRQDHLASLKSGSSMVKITYRGKTLLCVYMRHTPKTITVRTNKETINHLFNGATLRMSGPFTEVNIKFELREVQIANG